MIKLAAFDMGGVMIRADESIPVAEFARRSGASEQVVFDAIFSPEKKALVETGRVSPEQHARSASATLGIDMSSAEFWRVHCTSHSPDPIVGKIVQAVSEQVHIAIASNLPSPHWDWARENLTYSDRFNPTVLSFAIGVMKPERGYFEKLVQMAGTLSGEIFFVDDNEANVDSALKEGIQASLFTGPEQLSADLKKCGINA